MSKIEKGRRVMTLVNVFTVKPGTRSVSSNFWWKRQRKP